MRTSRYALVAVLAGLVGTPSFAFEKGGPARDAFKSGYAAYKSGDTESAIEALNYAAEQGHAASLWKLARMYATGDGIAADDAKAFAIYSRIANDYADVDPKDADSRYAASAFVALGAYYAKGLPGVESNPGQARRIYAYAASYFRDPEAQYRLGLMHLDGIGGDKSITQAARWLKLAAQKGHPYAQAEFGRLLFDGTEIRGNPVRGLMWLMIAQNSHAGDTRIQSLHNGAVAQSDEQQKSSAMNMAKDWFERSN